MTNISYYSNQSEISDPGNYQFLFEDLSVEISELCKVIQGIMLHIHWAERYGVSVTKERCHEEDLRKVERQLALIAERSSQGNPISLPQNKRIFGTCRDFSTLLCSMLRYHHIPARPRCGFATYFESGKNADHWICEYWDNDEKRWRMVDAQLDDFQQKSLNIAFDITDVPEDQFLIAGKAWQLCREGIVDPLLFGIMDWYGMWFIKGNLVRDLLSLSKVELLPWDINGMTGPYENHDIEDSAYNLLDSVASLTSESDVHYVDIIEMINKNPKFGMPSNWQS